MKDFKNLTICRSEQGNRPTLVKAVTEQDQTYQFEVAAELSDRRILALVGHLITHEQKGGKRK